MWWCPDTGAGGLVESGVVGDAVVVVIADVVDGDEDVTWFAGWFTGGFVAGASVGWTTGWKVVVVEVVVVVVVDVVVVVVVVIRGGLGGPLIGFNAL